MRAHFDAVKALIEAEPQLAGRVEASARVDHVGEPVRASYLVLYLSGPESRSDGRASTTQRVESRARYEMPFKAVGVDADGAALIVELMESVLIGKRPVVAGRTCTPISMDVESVEPDWSVKPPIFYVDGFIEFWSERG